MKRHSLEPVPPPRRSVSVSPHPIPIPVPKSAAASALAAPVEHLVVLDDGPKPTAPVVVPPTTEVPAPVLSSEQLAGWLEELRLGLRPYQAVWIDITNHCSAHGNVPHPLFHLLAPPSKAIVSDLVLHLRLQTEWISTWMDTSETQIEAQVNRTEHFLAHYRPRSRRALDAALDQVKTLKDFVDRTFAPDDHRGIYLKWIVAGSASKSLPVLWKWIARADLDPPTRSRLQARWRDISG